MSEQQTKLCECGNKMILRDRTPGMAVMTWPHNTRRTGSAPAAAREPRDRSYGVRH